MGGGFSPPCVNAGALKLQLVEPMAIGNIDLYGDGSSMWRNEVGVTILFGAKQSLRERGGAKHAH